MVNRRLIQNQQMILKALGYYTGKCDGIWSKQTIAAKQEFERSPKFKPAYPNGGMPFELNANSKFPTGMYLDPMNRGYLKCDELTDERVREWLGDLPEVYDNRREAVKTEKLENVVEAQKSKPVEDKKEPEDKDSSKSSNQKTRKLPG